MEENTVLLWVTTESLAWALGSTGLERKETRKGVPAREVAALPGSCDEASDGPGLMGRGGRGAVLLSTYYVPGLMVSASVYSAAHRTRGLFSSTKHSSQYLPPAASCKPHRGRTSVCLVSAVSSGPVIF